MLFYNAEGDESGGLAFDSDSAGGRRMAYGGLMFDRYKQDQTVGILYQEERGQLTSGLQAWERPDHSFMPTLRAIDSIRALPPSQQSGRFGRLQRSGELGAERVFVGRAPNRASEVRLSDRFGQPRLLLMVDSTGAPSIVFLDAAGRSVQKISPP